PVKNFLMGSLWVLHGSCGSGIWSAARIAALAFFCFFYGGKPDWEDQTPASSSGRVANLAGCETPAGSSGRGLTPSQVCPPAGRTGRGFTPSQVCHPSFFGIAARFMPVGRK